MQTKAAGVRVVVEALTRAGRGRARPARPPLHRTDCRQAGGAGRIEADVATAAAAQPGPVLQSRHHHQVQTRRGKKRRGRRGGGARQHEQGECLCRRRPGPAPL